MKYICFSTILLLTLKTYAGTNDNIVCFEFDQHQNNLATAIESYEINPTENWYTISKGEEFKGVSVSNEDSRGCLDIVAGQKNESSNVTWVKNGMTADNIPWDQYHINDSIVSWDAVPNALNFAIAVTALNFKVTKSESVISYTCNNLYIGQGHSGLKNNWWLSDNNDDKGHNNMISCHNDNNIVYFKVLPYNEYVNDNDSKNNVFILQQD